MSAQVQSNTSIYASAVEKKLQEAYNFMEEGKRPVVDVETGRKYFKVITNHGHQRSVHSFVDRVTGDVYKPASWNAPAKGVRYNVVTGLDVVVSAVDPYGSYLYAR
jgi:UDP-2,3-diacylglucosamine pyrophosphatase LpxH